MSCDSTTPEPRLFPSVTLRRSALSLAALVATGAGFPAHAELIGTLYPAPGFDIVMGASGYLELDGYLAPGVAYVTPDASSGGTYLGMRGLVATPTGPYALGTLGTDTSGGGYSVAQGVADSGLIVGTSELWANGGTLDAGQRAVWWGPGDVAPHAFAVPPRYTDANGVGQVGVSAISPGGAVVGWGVPDKPVQTVSPIYRALRWMTPTSAPEVLQRLPGLSEYGGNSSTAVSVNDSGAAVGQGSAYDSSNHLLGISALRWDAGTTDVTPLGHLGSASDGTYRSSANAIDSHGNAVGMSMKYDAAHTPLGTVAVRWLAKSTTPVELGNLGVGADGQASTYAVGLNESGTVFGVGVQFTPEGVPQGWRAVRWLPGETKARALKPLTMGLSGSTWEYAYGINRKGWIAGSANAVLTSSDDASDPNHLDTHAVVWGPDGSIHDLNKLLPAGSLWKLFGAYAISDSGLVTGIGYYGVAFEGQTYYDWRIFSMQLTKMDTAQ